MGCHQRSRSPVHTLSAPWAGRHVDTFSCVVRVLFSCAHCTLSVVPLWPRVLFTLINLFKRAFLLVFASAAHRPSTTIVLGVGVFVSGLEPSGQLED